MTTPTPEAIDAAARAIAVFDENDWDALLDTDKDDYGILATAALTAAAPLIEARAKVEALREAADAILTNDPLDYWDQHLPEGLGFQEAMSKWLLAHTATIERKSE